MERLDLSLVGEEGFMHCSAYIEGSKGSVGPDAEIGGCKSHVVGIGSSESDTLAWKPADNLPILECRVNYEEFYIQYLLRNRPCLLESRITGDWNCVKDWKKDDGEINFEFLKNKYGHCKVSVTPIVPTTSMAYGSIDCEVMEVSDFIEYWAKYIATDYHPSMACLYLKDWHIVKDSSPLNYNPYTTPLYFRSDWLNEACEGQEDDFRFAYMGPAGSWTPFHADVYGSHSWSANILGRKRWRLYPPGKESPFLSTSSILEYDLKNPGIKGQDYVELVQGPGEVIFVPSGWHHLVWNETDTISINHNWFNGSNICYIWAQLKKGMTEVKNEIAEFETLPDFFDQCELILKANHGMNYASFLDLIVTILDHRKDPEDCETRGLSPGHVAFDLQVLKHLFSGHLSKNSDILDHFSDRLEKIGENCEDGRR